MTKQVDFKKELEFGEMWEKKFTSLIGGNGFKKMEGNFKEYDIEVYSNEGTKYYEIKADRMTYKTGNIAIEYNCYGKPSGISTTTADYYAYFAVKPHDLYDLYIIPVEVLKEKINAKKYKRQIAGGDKGLSLMYLFDINNFSEYKHKQN